MFSYYVVLVGIWFCIIGNRTIVVHAEEEGNERCVNLNDEDGQEECHLADDSVIYHNNDEDNIMNYDYH